jgi:hypothetical protein
MISHSGWSSLAAGKARSGPNKRFTTSSRASAALCPQGRDVSADPSTALGMTHTHSPRASAEPERAQRVEGSSPAGIEGSAPRSASLNRSRRATFQLRHTKRGRRGNIGARARYSVMRRRVTRDRTQSGEASRPVHVRTTRSATRVAARSPAAVRDSTCPRSHAVPPLSEGSTANGRHNCKDGVACPPHAQEPGLLRDGAARLASCAARRRCSPRSATTSGSDSSTVSAHVGRCPPCA